MGPEDRLNLVLAAKLVDSPEFARWIIGRTKFAEQSSNARVLHEEQRGARTAKFWWRHWWCFVPELESESETDILVCFETMTTRQRFALHIENKVQRSTFQEKQAENYAARARYMLQNTKSAVLKCTDFDTVLIAPSSFRSVYKEKCDHFGCFIAHEEIAEFIPEFKSGN